MKTKNLCLRDLNLALAATIAAACLWYAAPAMSQQQQPPAAGSASTDKFPAAKAKAQTPAAARRDADAESEKEVQAQGETGEKDSPEAIQRREEWFYKQRASVNGRIPGGARLKALQHMQRMMTAEGKLVQRPDGSYAEVAPQTGATTFPAWSSIGPTPTTGGTFSPVTGRITTIAVDPSDSTGNTVLIGGAQGGIWRSTDAGQTWTAVGDQNPSLAMGSIAFAPSQTGTVYAGTGEQASIGFDVYYGAGVLKSTDHGLTWTQTCTAAGLSCPFIGPYTDGLNPGFGFFNFGGARISYVAVNPTNPNLILVGAQFLVEGRQEGVYCSSNGGASWTNILPDEMATFVGFASSSVAFVALGNPFGSSPGAPHGNGIYKSTNATSCSATFVPVAGGLPAQGSLGRMDLGISPNYASDNTVYASIADASTASTSSLGVWVTTNGGTLWTQQTSVPDVCRGQCWYDDVIKVGPNNKSLAFFGGSSLLDGNGNPMWVVRTTNGGTSWSTALPSQFGPSLPHVDTHALAFFKLPGGKVRLYLGNDGGIWRTDDAEASTITWTNLNDSLLTLTQFYPSISINTSSPSIAFAGTQDNGSQNYQGGVGWVDNHLCGDGASTAVDPLVPSTVYIGCATGYPVNASYQNGSLGTFSPAVNGISPSDYSGFIAPIATDASTPSVVYYGTTKLYQSVDAGNSWVSVSGGDLAAGYNGDVLTTIAVDPGNPSVIYAGSSSGHIFMGNIVSPGAGSFTQHPNSGSIFPTRAVTAIAIDPSDSTGNTAYVSISGFSFVGNDPLGNSVNDPIGHVFKTTNGGFSLIDVSCSVAVCSTPAASDLPNIPVNDLVLDPDVPGTLYAATDLGVYVGSCGTSTCTWSTLGTGLPRVAVLSIRLHEASRTLRAATHGRGVWDVALNNFPFNGPRIFSLTPTSASVGGAQLTLTVTGTGLTGGTILFGSTALTTTAIQPDTKLSATISSAMLVAGTPQVSVKVATTTSNTLPFAVLALTPTLSSSNPPSTPVQIPPAPLTNIPVQLAGTNFASSARILFNGSYSGITSTLNSSTALSATLPSALLGPFGSTNDLAVINTPPGGGRSTPITFKVVSPAPANDNFANAINITSLSYSDVRDSSSATFQTGDPTPPAACVPQLTSGQGNTGGFPNGAYNTIWYQFTPVFSANLNADTVGSSYDTVLSIWRGAAGSLTSIACNDDINPGIVTQSQLSGVPLTAGTTYYMMVSSFGPPDPNPTALGGRSQLNFSYNFGDFPAPSLSSISPTSTNSGGPDVPLTVNGSGFLSGATLFFQNPFTFVQTPLATTVVSPTQVTATIPASTFVLPGPYIIFAQNQNPTNAQSNPQVFTVNLGTYPVPTLTSITPTSVLATSSALTICASGTNFAPGAVLNFNGVAVTGNVPYPSNMCANIPVSQITLANVGTVQVSVSNPSPGGGPSNSIPFQIIMPNPIPTVTSVSPNSSPVGPANPVTITINGTNFQSGASVTFSIGTSGLPIQSTFVSATQLTGTLLPGYHLTTPGTYGIFVTDPYPGGTSNSVPFTVTGPPDFSFTIAAGLGSQTVNAGQTATYTNVISINAVNGFTGQVAVSCTSPAQATTCSLNQNTLTAGQSATVMVSTTVRSMAPPLPLNRRIISWPRLVPVMVVMLLCVLLTRLARTRRQRMLASLPLAGALLFLVLQAVGCGGGSYQAPPPPTGTLAGTYTITVTGTSNNPAATHTATLQLIVN